MNYALDFAPHIPLAILWLLAGVAAALILYALLMRARGAWARALAFAIVLLALANPLIVHETREP
jgi:Na+-translocating ferredoxin:NAD+ oxidoreductase RnfD subunit